ncbi:Major facilitator superfamily [Penicillium roqueforti FM164]|uniref:Major facilitator superfamily n=1 Tax=Penicillium roqueforti (strain FM164) TaxID=1365484 RepID=W6QF34_PENRF|nr:Major facilitator superfamily [Penicillium roqueforti FM164]
MILAPLSELYGRNIIYHVCNVLCLLMTITCALAPNLLGFMVCRLLAGTAGSVPLSIGAGSLADMIPSKNRGLAMGARSCAWTRDSAHSGRIFGRVSKAFDAGANGYCRGEGVGVVVLKTLPQALADGNEVLGCLYDVRRGFREEASERHPSLSPCHR